MSGPRDIPPNDPQPRQVSPRLSYAFLESARVAPETAGSPGLPADLFTDGMPHREVARVSKSLEEKELETFLSSLPSFWRKEFEHGISSFNQDEMNEWWKREIEDPDTAAAQR